MDPIAVALPVLAAAAVITAVAVFVWIVIRRSR